MVVIRNNTLVALISNKNFDNTFFDKLFTVCSDDNLFIERQTKNIVTLFLIQLIFLF